MKKISIIGFLEKDGFIQANRVIRGGCAPTMLSRDYKDATKVLKQWKKKSK